MVLDDIVEAGQVRAIGITNYNPKWRGVYASPHKPRPDMPYYLENAIFLEAEVQILVNNGPIRVKSTAVRNRHSLEPDYFMVYECKILTGPHAKQLVYTTQILLDDFSRLVVLEKTA